ncbi:MAG: lysylphosphatidylglycerol synthase domain-containing protein [Chloroflexi bacterium]|nr:lysylphosphatidylglycerol synthase domain-containing protein [Chloroflexota bacterium]MCL5075623.1 lysylphosphatidylglycerol synthase domain-containing protein [Chloroflexota bacterium]
MLKNTQQRVITALLVALTFVFLGYSLYQSWHELSRYEWAVNYLYLSFSFLLYPITFLLLAWGWSSIIRGLGAACGFWLNLQIYAQAALAKRIPGTLWYVAGRVYLYNQQGVHRSVTLMGTFIEIALIILSGASLSLLTIPFYFETVNNQIGFFMVLPLLSVLILASPKIVSAMGRFFWRMDRGQSASLPEMKIADILGCLLIYIVTWVLGGVVLYCLTKAIYPLEVQQLPQIISVWVVAGTISSVVLFAPSGLGVREISLSLLLSRYLPLSIAIVVALLFRVLLTLGEVGSVLSSLALTHYIAKRRGDHSLIATEGGPLDNH